MKALLRWRRTSYLSFIWQFTSWLHQ